MRWSRPATVPFPFTFILNFTRAPPKLLMQERMSCNAFLEHVNVILASWRLCGQVTLLYSNANQSIRYLA